MKISPHLLLALRQGGLVLGILLVEVVTILLEQSLCVPGLAFGLRQLADRRIGSPLSSERTCSRLFRYVVRALEIRFTVFFNGAKT